jgi:hypothetical protein
MLRHDVVHVIKALDAPAALVMLACDLPRRHVQASNKVVVPFRL